MSDAEGRGLSRQDKIEQAVRDGFDERYLDTAACGWQTFHGTTAPARVVSEQGSDKPT